MKKRKTYTISLQITRDLADDFASCIANNFHADGSVHPRGALARQAIEELEYCIDAEHLGGNPGSVTVLVLNSADIEKLVYPEPEPKPPTRRHKRGTPPRQLS